MTYFENFLKQFGDKKIDIYVDMDGVVADIEMLNFEQHKNDDDVYLNKRPVQTVINILEEVSHLNNVTIYILSVSRNENQIPGKVEWLKKNMSFITLDHINILPREGNDFKPAKELKRVFLKGNIDKDAVNISIDDSHNVLNEVYALNLDIIPLHISSIID